MFYEINIGTQYLSAHFAITLNIKCIKWSNGFHPPPAILFVFVSDDNKI